MSLLLWGLGLAAGAVAVSVGGGRRRRASAPASRERAERGDSDGHDPSPEVRAGINRALAAYPDVEPALVYAQADLETGGRFAPQTVDTIGEDTPGGTRPELSLGMFGVNIRTPGARAFVLSILPSVDRLQDPEDGARVFCEMIRRWQTSGILGDARGPERYERMRLIAAWGEGGVRRFDVFAARTGRPQTVRERFRPAFLRWLRRLGAVDPELEELAAS